MTKEYPIKCLDCGNIYNKQITNSHLKKHNMTTTDYIEKYGEGSLTSELYRQERSLAMSGENNPNYGNTMTEESKQKISNANRNREGYWKGKSLPESTKQKQSETKKKKFKSGELTAWNKGGSVSEEVKEKISKSVKQYASENPELLSNRAKKAQQTLAERYGDEYLKEKQQKMIAAVTPEGKQRQKESLIKYNKIKSEIAEANFIERLTLAKYTLIRHNRKTNHVTYRCCNGIVHTNHRMYFIPSYNDLKVCKMCQPKNVSAGELELRNYIQTLVGNKISFNDKITIWPHELDIIVKSKNIAFEYNGLYYHSVEMGKFKNYHINKTNMCNTKGIELVHIFEDEWLYKKDIVKSIVRNKLVTPSVIITHSDCIVKEISAQETEEFIDTYDIKGYKKSKVKLGLLYNGDIIQVMTFSNHKSKSDNSWQIERFTTKFDHLVVGGVNKMFEHFIENYNPEEVFNYTDTRFEEGNVYQGLGFEYLYTTEPKFFYIKGQTRTNVNISNTKSSMKEVNKIYDCGYNKWIWKKK